MPITDLLGMLDLSGPQSALGTQLSGSVAGLDALQPPSVDLSGAAPLSITLDSEVLLASVARAADSAGGLGAGLPDPGDLVAPVSGALALLSPGPGGEDPASSLRALLDRLRFELEVENRDPLSTLEALGVKLGEAPEARSLQGLLTAAFGGRGELDLRAAVGEALPALVATLRGIGAAMALESVLGEGERLARILSAQLDGEAVGTSLDGVASAIEVGSFSLDRLRTEGAAPTPELLADTLQAVGQFRVRVGETLDFLNRSLGFGEATLVQLDLPGLAARVGEYSQVLQAVDTDVVARAVEAVMGRFGPLLSGAALVEPPSDSLDGVLTLLETHAAAIAQSVDGVEVERLAEPVISALNEVTGVLGTVASAAEEVVVAVHTALAALKSAVQALPLDEIAATIRVALDPVREAMEFATGLVADLQSALNDVVGAATTSLEEAERAIDSFKEQTDRALGEAAAFVEALNLDSIVAQVADAVGTVSHALGQAQVKPYFDAAVEGIEGAADVIGAVPLGLLPEEMKGELDEAVAPIRAIDIPSTVEEVEGWFQIEDGRFKLRAPLEAAVADIQAQYASFLEQVELADPRRLVEPLNGGLATVREQVERMRLDLQLAPLEESIDKVREALAGFDLRQELASLDEAFAPVLEAIDRYSPAALIAPLEEELDRARAQFEETLKLDRWDAVLDDVESEVQALVDWADPSLLADQLSTAHAEALRLLDRLEDLRLGDGFGELMASLLSGGLPVRGWSVDALGSWLAGESAAEKLVGRAGAISTAIGSTRDAVASLDLSGFRTRARQTAAELRAALDGLPAGPEKTQAINQLEGLKLDQALARLEANRSRYQASLDASAEAADVLARVGVSQVDVTLRHLQSALAPALEIRAAFRRTLEIVGIRRVDAALPDAIRSALQVATPARIVAILAPIAEAVRGRIMSLLTTMLAPVRTGIGEITTLLAAVDLTPVREDLEGVVSALKAEIAALSPLAILEPTLTGFEAFKTELEAFDPLGPVRTLLDALRSTALRILEKLDGESLLEHPIAIYDEIMSALRAVSVEALLAPILDQLDALAGQIGSGLDETAAALVHLQDVLPSGGGGSTASLGATVAVG